MSEKSVTQSLLLPELRYVKENWNNRVRIIECFKTSEFEVCPHCATKSSSIYDHRYTRPKDEPIRNKLVTLVIKKRRFKCQNPNCAKVFTGPVAGIRKGFRTTERFRSKTRRDASKFMNLKTHGQRQLELMSTLFKGAVRGIKESLLAPSLTTTIKE